MSAFKGILQQLIPAPIVPYARHFYHSRQRARIAALAPLTESMLLNILTADLKLKHGDVVFIHSSIDQLNLTFPFYRVLHLIRQVVGATGTLLFPTYPKLTSYEYLSTGDVFDVRRSPSYTGIITEFARKQKDAVRSLHPTKSVCALGKYATELTGTHQQSPYPYDSCSPYYRMMERDGKIIGLGVSTKNLSFVHCVDDALKEEFPVQPYHPTLFQARCINYSGAVDIVSTFAHNRQVMNFNLPLFMKRYIPKDICEDMRLYGMNFFSAKSKALFGSMLDLARKNVTIYCQKS
jgi:aminoglycoside 3-N-acetyltransferase